MDTIIRVEHVSRKFHMDLTHTNSLKEFFVTRLKGKAEYKDFYALTDVSFEVERGEVIGIIGRNGSGKSTLLKVISGIYKPSEGTCVAAGRIAPMLELGSGFDPELSGHENIFLNGAILGFDEKFLKSRYDSILAFSELGDFIYQPVKTYSSGMLTRLAFSVATIVEPEILIVDEILSVGDSQFRAKSYRRMMELMAGGTTVLMVSHDINQIRRMCTRCLWLDHGRVRAYGPTEEITAEYEEFMKVKG